VPRLLWFLSALVIVGACSPRRTSFQDRAGLYAAALARFHADPRRDVDVIFVGDSLVAWHNWQRDLPGLVVLNRGVPSDRASWLKGRLDEIIARQPRQIFVQIGVNDLFAGASPEASAAEVTARVMELKRAVPSAEVVELSLLPTDRRAERSLIREVNERLQRSAAAAGARYLDLWPDFADHAALYGEDGIHLTKAGYALWVARITPLVVPPRPPRAE
jgi:lysophospholipase L1-like esterase